MTNFNSKNIFKKIESNILYQVLTCIALSSIIIIIFFILYKIIDFKKFREYNIVNDIKLMNSVENISIENDTLKLEGYAFYLNQDSTNASISLFLKNLKNNDEKTINSDDIFKIVEEAHENLN